MPDSQPGNENENWFKRHIIEKLTDLQQGQASMLVEQRRMHEANQVRIDNMITSSAEHVASDAKAFAAIHKDLEALKPVRIVVYSVVAMILATVFGGLIALVVNGPHR